MLDAYRDAACLAHTAPGVALRLRANGAHEVLVSASCLAAPLDPCQFRGLVIAGLAGQHAALCQFGTVDIVGGLVHLGGGLYQPSHPGGADDRWFATSLDHDQVTALLSDCPHPAAINDAFSVMVRPDRQLGRCAVRVRCDERRAAPHLDEVAMWSLTACLVDELIASSSAETAPSSPETS